MSNELIIREARPEECEALSALCMRSKAHWGYDQAILAQCEDELSLLPEDIVADHVVVADDQGSVKGVLHAILSESEAEPARAEIEKLFVDPAAMGCGLGKALFNQACAWACEHGVLTLELASDPQAVPFYQSMGMVQIGQVPSGSIKGRSLPLMRLDLGSD